jgi:hypothetical protein
MATSVEPARVSKNGMIRADMTVMRVAVDRTLPVEEQLHREALVKVEARRAFQRIDGMDDTPYPRYDDAKKEYYIAFSSKRRNETPVLYYRIDCPKSVFDEAVAAQSSDTRAPKTARPYRAPSERGGRGRESRYRNGPRKPIRASEKEVSFDDTNEFPPL